MTVVDLAYSRLDSLRRYAGSLSWGPLLQLSRSTILSVLRQIEVGELTIEDINGQTTVCGNAAEGHSATRLKVHKETFWVRMLLFADMVGLQIPSLADHCLTVTIGLCRKLYARGSLVPRSYCFLRGMHSTYTHSASMSNVNTSFLSSTENSCLTAAHSRLRFPPPSVVSPAPRTPLPTPDSISQHITTLAMTCSPLSSLQT